MSAGRPILAARTSSGEASRDGATSPGSSRPPPPSGGGGGGGGGSSSGRAKRTLIESACSACRRRKSRCNGGRPTCSRCQNLRTDCHYEAEEGESRWSALRRRNQVLEAERDQLLELIALVQTRPEPEAQDIFQRIRQTNYDDLMLLLRHIKDGSLGMPPSRGALPVSIPGAGTDQRLPPIQTILDVPSRGITPTNLTHQHSLSSDDSRGSVSDIGTLPLGHHPHGSLLDTLEPSLRQPPGQQVLPTSRLPLTSEDSWGSASSTSMDQVPRHYRDP